MVATPMTGLEDEGPPSHPEPEFPIPRTGDAREIAACISWLCSPDARWTTGVSILADGGYMQATPPARPDEAD